MYKLARFWSQVHKTVVLFMGIICFKFSISFDKRLTQLDSTAISSRVLKLHKQM